MESRTERKLFNKVDEDDAMWWANWEEFAMKVEQEGMSLHIGGKNCKDGLTSQGVKEVPK